MIELTTCSSKLSEGDAKMIADMVKRGVIAIDAEFSSPKFLHRMAELGVTTYTDVNSGPGETMEWALERYGEE